MALKVFEYCYYCGNAPTANEDDLGFKLRCNNKACQNYFVICSNSLSGALDVWNEYNRSKKKESDKIVTN